MSKKVKVMVMKMYEVEGKKMAKSVSLSLDPEKMVGYSSVSMVKKKVLEMVVDARVFAPDELKELKFDMKDFLKEWRSEMRKKEEERKNKLEEVEQI